MPLPIPVWLAMLYTYEMWCYDMGWEVIDDHHKALEEYWDGL